MVEGGANTNYTEDFIQGLVELIQGNNSLKEVAESFLQGENTTDVNLADPDKIIELLGGDKSKEFLETMSKKLSEEEKFKKLAEQIGKDQAMMEKLEALGNRLLIQGVIGGAAFTTLTGALAGTLAIGGVAGALVGGGIALLGFLAIVAIAAIGYAIYKHRGEIKEDAIDAGKIIKSFVKNLIDQLPTIQARENNFTKLKSDSLEQHRKSTGEEQIKLNNKIEIITMLQDEGRRSAIKELIKDGTIQNFSEDEMTRFVEKGTSTHENDMEALNELMEKFQPTIMAIGNNNIEEVKEKVNEKVRGKESPSGEMDVSNAEQVGTTERQPGSS